ncbi:MAG: Mor transcription activator family protein [Syntrophus sp. PtaB.Bin001]|nr:MAG: Mor transcription activator family protein [Syntrophus sp. PtaB.Bin001]
MNNDWIAEIAQDISIESLPESYQVIAGIIGIENTLKLSRHIGGMDFYFRKIDSLLLQKRDEKIRTEFNGFNHRELARKYGLTETWIREILRKKPVYEQAGLFDE